jgi:hypothetical protein
MSSEKGERLGPYEALAPLGAGGMGEVHLARDTRLRRGAVGSERWGQQSGGVRSQFGDRTGAHPRTGEGSHLGIGEPSCGSS